MPPLTGPARLRSPDPEAALALLTSELDAIPIDDTTWRRLAAGYDH